MTEQQEEQNEKLRALVLEREPRKPRLDMKDLQAAVEAGRRTLVPEHVDAKKILPDLEPADWQPAAAASRPVVDASDQVKETPAPVKLKRRSRVPRATAQLSRGDGEEFRITTIRLRAELHRAVKIHSAKTGKALNEIVCEFLEAEFQAGRFS